MSLKKSRFIVISATTSLVKVAQVSRAGFVEKIAKKAVDKNAVDEALRQALVGFDIKTSGIICTVPGEVATAKHLEVPATDNDEIESILALQAARHTPFSKEEILISYVKIGSPKPHFTRVLLVVVKRDAIKERMVWLKSAALKMDTVSFVPEGVARFYGQALKGKKGEAPVVLIDVNMQSTNFIVQSNGLPLMSRSIPVGIEHLCIDTESPKQLIDEIKTSMDAFNQEKIDKTPTRCVVTVNHMGLGTLPADLSAVISIPVDVLAYTSYVKGNKGIQDQLFKDFADDSALDVIACGVTAGKCQAELVPQEIKDQRAIAGKAAEILKAGIFILGSLILVLFAVTIKGHFRDQFLKKNLMEKYSTQHQEVKDLQVVMERTEILRQFLQGREMPLEAIRELYRIIPVEIYLSGVNMDENGMVSIQGVSDVMSKVFNFVTALEASDFFEGVKTKSTSTKKDRNKDVAVFEIILKLSTDGSEVSRSSGSGVVDATAK